MPIDQRAELHTEPVFALVEQCHLPREARLPSEGAIPPSTQSPHHYHPSHATSVSLKSSLQKIQLQGPRVLRLKQKRKEREPAQRKEIQGAKQAGEKGKEEEKGIQGA